MNCCFLKNGDLCNNKVLNKSKYCYNKLHHPNEKEYKKAIEHMKIDWINETYSIDKFKKHNVPTNGWCLFNSIAMSLVLMYDKTKNKKIKNFLNEFKPFDSKEFNEKICYKLFIISKKWLLDNINKFHKETNEPISDFIKSTCDIQDLNEYFVEIDYTQNLDNKYWGGICEQYAISNYFEVNFIVFLPTMYSFSKKEKEYKVEISKVVRKNLTRYKISNCCFSTTKDSYFFKYTNSLYIETLPKDLEEIKNEINNTIFLVLFILKDKDNDDISHYNYLLYNDI